MDLSGASGIVLALAVVLWLCYIVPVWIRRQNQRSSARAAIELQRTVRALAASSDAEGDADGVVTVRATPRELAAQRRRLKRVERSSIAPGGAEALDAAARARQAQRRGKLLSTGTGVIGLTMIAAGLISCLFTVTVAAIATAVGGALATLLAAWMLARLNRVAAKRQAPVLDEKNARRVSSAMPDIQLTEPLDVRISAADTDRITGEASTGESGWTPRPVPRPLYLDRDEAPADIHRAKLVAVPNGPDDDGPRGPSSRESDGDVFADLLAAAKRSEQSIRDAHRQSGVATFGAEHAGETNASSETASSDEDAVRDAPESGDPEMGGEDDTPEERTNVSVKANTRNAHAQSETVESGIRSKWDLMGRIDEIEPGFDDLSEVLRRRRAG